MGSSFAAVVIERMESLCANPHHAQARGTILALPLDQARIARRYAGAPGFGLPWDRLEHGDVNRHANTQG